MQLKNGTELMRICLVSLIEDVGYTNLRYLSSYIRSKGHQTRLIFLPRLYSERWEAHESYRYPYSDRTLNQLAELCLDSDIIGLSLMSCHLDNAVHITKFLRKLNKPIIWGGIHPTINPQECLDYADLVCVGEGEHSIVNLLNWIEKLPYEDALIHGILTQKNHQLTVGQVVENLDDLGFPDYDFDHQFILYDGNIVKLNKTILSECFKGTYRTSFSRGCAMSCSYCCNNVLKQLYGTRPIRWRSIDKQIDELKMAIGLFDGLESIDFADDTFLSRPYTEIRDFAVRYRKEIGLPFKILTTPLSVSYGEPPSNKSDGFLLQRLPSGVSTSVNSGSSYHTEFHSHLGSALHDSKQRTNYISRPLSPEGKLTNNMIDSKIYKANASNTPDGILYNPTPGNKIKILANAGLCNVGIGVQSAYEPVRKLYKRHESIKQIEEASKIIKKVSKDVEKPISIRYDFITDNPWGGEKDTEENIRFATTIPKPREICIFSLVFYHGTELAEKAKKEGIIKDELNEVYRVTQLSPKNTYMNEVFLLLAMGCPEWIIKILLNKNLRSMVTINILKSAMHIVWYIKNPIFKTIYKNTSAQFNGKVGEIT